LVRSPFYDLYKNISNTGKYPKPIVLRETLKIIILNFIWYRKYAKVH